MVLLNTDTIQPDIRNIITDIKTIRLHFTKLFIVIFLSFLYSLETEYRTQNLSL